MGSDRFMKYLLTPNLERVGWSQALLGGVRKDLPPLQSNSPRTFKTLTLFDSVILHLRNLYSWKIRNAEKAYSDNVNPRIVHNNRTSESNKCYIRKCLRKVWLALKQDVWCSYEKHIYKALLMTGEMFIMLSDEGGLRTFHVNKQLCKKACAREECKYTNV